jgi:hypothetical protein
MTFAKKNMKTLILITLIVAGLVGISAAEVELTETESKEIPKEFESLITTRGKTYNKVKVRDITPAGIRIFHEAGAATIPYQELPEEIQKQLGDFDPEEAKRHQEQENIKARAQELALDRAVNATQQQEQEKKEEKMLDGVKMPTRIQIQQMNEGGALCTVSFKLKRKVQNRVPSPFGGYNVTEEERLVWTGYSEEWYFVAGLPNSLVDGDTWEGWTLPSGSFPYTNTLGARKTVRKLSVQSPPQK